MSWSTLTSLKWRTWMLGLTNLLVIWACVIRLWQGSATQSLLATRPLRIEVPAALQDPVVNAIDLAAVQNAALFYESRNFYVPPVTPQIQAPPDYKLSGTLVIPGKPTVAMLIQNRSGARLKVRTGEALDGWIVESIQPHSILLSSAGRQFEIQSATPIPPHLTRKRLQGS